MGRSRVYCTHSASANWQHNASTARLIPWHHESPRGDAYAPAASVYPNHARAPTRVTRDLSAPRVSNRSRESSAVGM
jgi:hypothetical protein